MGGVGKASLVDVGAGQLREYEQDPRGTIRKDITSEREFTKKITYLQCCTCCATTATIRWTLVSLLVSFAFLNMPGERVRR